MSIRASCLFQAIFPASLFSKHIYISCLAGLIYICWMDGFYSRRSKNKMKWIKIKPYNKTGKIIAKRRITTRITGAFRCLWDPIEGPWKPSEHHSTIVTRGLRGTLYPRASIMPRDASLSDFIRYYLYIPCSIFINDYIYIYTR